MSVDTPYYRKSMLSKIATELSLAARQSIVNLFFEAFPPLGHLSVLDLGVTSERDPSANFLEKLYPFPENLTCAGMQDANWLTEEYPGTKFVQLEVGKPLPFKDQEFDCVYSNAVIEHVGSRCDQEAFIRELMRVSKNFYITTPNRWFPVEMHTHIPLLHLLPQKLFRYLLKLKGEAFYAEEKNLNLLTRQNLLDLFPKETNPNAIYIWSCGFPSNIIVYGSSISKS
ncbi:MAG: class I SAM-dependent methyltransferase [Methylococcales bacterium]